VNRFSSLVAKSKTCGSQKKAESGQRGRNWREMKVIYLLSSRLLDDVDVTD